MATNPIVVGLLGLNLTQLPIHKKKAGNVRVMPLGGKVSLSPPLPLRIYILRSGNGGDGEPTAREQELRPFRSNLRPRITPLSAENASGLGRVFMSDKPKNGLTSEA